MSGSTRFLLLVIIGIAIAVLGSHFLTIILAIALMLVAYAMPILIVLALMVVAWRLVLGEGKKEEPKQLPSAQPTKPIKPAKPDLNNEIDREINRMKHQIGQMNKQKKP